MDELLLVIPRWFYPNNLGDSIHSYFVPKVIKHKYPNSQLDVITHGELVPLMQKNPYVNKALDITQVNQMFIKDPVFWRGQSFKEQSPPIFSLYAEWHPRLWEFWNDNFDRFANHPTANLLTVNSLLQLGMEDLLDTDFDFHTPIKEEVKATEPKTLGIVPATKLAGRPTPHPGCDGIGLRFNGDNGESWQAFVARVKELDPEINIVEYSYENFGFGDEHVPHMEWGKLLVEAGRPKVTVLSDGGMHHVFNMLQKPVVILGAQKINKPDFFRLGNAQFYNNLHQPCLSQCGDKIRNLSGWPDLDSCCTGVCQSVDPVALADEVYRRNFT